MAAQVAFSSSILLLKCYNMTRSCFDKRRILKEEEKMMIKRLFMAMETVFFGLILAFGVCAQQRLKQRAQEGRESCQSQQVKASTRADKYVPVHAYDPKRNADQDIKDAVAEANREGKRVLLEVG